MKRILSALVALVLLASPVLAFTDIDVQLYSQGTTNYAQFATVGGYDSTEHSNQMTASVLEEIYNKGTLVLSKSIDNPSAWNMVESQAVSGSGSTSIEKLVVWWTEDSSLDCYGNMKWPTVANIYTEFVTLNPPFVEKIEIHNTANLNVEDPAGQFSTSSFVWDTYTTNDFSFVESVGINLPFDCTPERPDLPDMPDCLMGC